MSTIRSDVAFLVPGRGRTLDGIWRWDLLDPLAVRLCLGSGEPWRLSRDALCEAFDRPVGECDVWLCVALGALVVELSSPDGRMTLVCDAGLVREFLDATFEVCPPGGAGERGAVSAALDRALGRITEEEAA